MKEIYVLEITEAELISEGYCLENFPKRYERANRFRFREDKLRCIGAGALLCAMAEIRESDITYNEYGKPLCEGKHFSLSHSGDYAVLALSDRNVGVDIESVARKHADITKRVCTPEELAWIDASTDENVKAERFFSIWTLKESIMKAEGQGLSIDPKALDVLPMTKGDPAKIAGKDYYGESKLIGGYVLSVCGTTNEPSHISFIRKEML